VGVVMNVLFGMLGGWIGAAFFKSKPKA